MVKELNSQLPEGKNYLSYFQMQKLIMDRSHLKMIWYDSCKNDCIAFTGSYADLEKCPACNEPRNSEKSIYQIPVINYLKHIFQTKNSCESMLYRYNNDSQKESETDGYRIIEDVYSGVNYRKLIEEGFFKSKWDFAYSMTLDGYSIMKDKGTKPKSATIIALVNNNLSPKIRFKFLSIPVCSRFIRI